MLLSTKNLKLRVPSRKLGPRFVRPFLVLDVVGSQAYRLILPRAMKIHDVFHVSLMEYWRGDGEADAESMPLAQQAEEWEVEEILDHRARKGQRQYFVKWKGCHYSSLLMVLLSQGLKMDNEKTENFSLCY